MFLHHHSHEGPPPIPGKYDQSNQPGGTRHDLGSTALADLVLYGKNGASPEQLQSPELQDSVSRQ